MHEHIEYLRAAKAYNYTHFVASQQTWIHMSIPTQTTIIKLITCLIKNVSLNSCILQTYAFFVGSGQTSFCDI